MWLEYNQLSGIIPENICDLPIDWSGETLWGDDVIKLSNNNFCSPPPQNVLKTMSVNKTPLIANSTS